MDMLITIQLHGIWNPKDQCRIHKNFLITLILSKINPILRINIYIYFVFFKIDSNVVLPSTPRPL